MDEFPGGRIMACTCDYGGFPELLFMDVLVGPAFDPKQDEPMPDTTQVKAIWDTGASASCITAPTVAKLQLPQYGQGDWNTAGGKRRTDTYLVSVFLPNKVCIPSLVVGEGDLGPIEMLVGLDVIRQGDFAVTNHLQKTVCSYRFPAAEHIDFLKHHPRDYHPPGVPSKNRPCPCNSGKLYKRCCGRRK